MEALESEQVYVSPWMSVREDRVRWPDGSTGRYSVVDAADCALVIPVDGSRIHLVEQYRYPLAARCWEFPSGSADQPLDTDMAGTATRELREETGLVASNVTRLGTLDVMPSTLNQRCAVFLATGLTQLPPRREPAEHDMRSAWFDRADIERMIADGTIADAKTVAAYALLLIGERQ